MEEVGNCIAKSTNSNYLRTIHDKYPDELKNSLDEFKTKTKRYDIMTHLHAKASITKKSKDLKRNLKSLKQNFTSRDDIFEGIERRVLVPIGQLKLNKLLIYYYMKKKYPKFVQQIEKELDENDDEKENDQKDIPNEKSSSDLDAFINEATGGKSVDEDEFLKRHEPGIKTIMASLLSKKMEQDAKQIEELTPADPQSNTSLLNNKKPVGSLSLPGLQETSTEASQITSTNIVPIGTSATTVGTNLKGFGKDTLNENSSLKELHEFDRNSVMDMECPKKELKCLVANLVTLLRDTYMNKPTDKKDDSSDSLQEHLSINGKPSFEKNIVLKLTTKDSTEFFSSLDLQTISFKHLLGHV